LAKRRRKADQPSEQPAETSTGASGTSRQAARGAKKTGRRKKAASVGAEKPAGKKKPAGDGEKPAVKKKVTPPAGRKPPAKKKAASAGEKEAVAGKKATDQRGRTKPRRKKGTKESAKPQAQFGGMDLSKVMMAALEEAGYIDPTPVQAGLIPSALKGDDLMGQARTGTGKTAAFAIPILERLDSQEPEERSELPRAIVLAPTRELAVQVRDEFAKLAAGRNMSIVALYGGKPIRHQIDQLHHGVDVVVGTPGRIIDLINRRALLLAEINCVVLDEADRMLDIGFRPDIEKILRRCPTDRQTLLLSATIPQPVARLARRYMKDPELLDFSTSDLAVETIEQFYFTVDPRLKFDLLARLLRREEPAQAIIFCRTKRGTDKVAQRLTRKFDGAACIHGDLPQRSRDSVMGRFRQGKIRYLVATDVVGRGIDVTSISHIINYDIPQFCDDYVHRVGRTGRMGREGVAYTFITPEEGNELTRIEIRINRLLKRDEMADFAAVLEPDTVPEGSPPPAPKPVFGRRTRRVRRAL
jgi:ATP-dependent RNA helicase DeaD